MTNVRNEPHDKPKASIEGLINFRDLGNSTRVNEKEYVKEGYIFRSGTLDSLTTEQVDQLIDTHKIKTILDLRTSLEVKNNLPIDKSFPTMGLDTLNAKDLIGERGRHQEAQTEIDHGRKKYRINFAGRSFQRHVILHLCNPWLKMKILFWLLLRNKARATSLVGREVLTPMGVPTMYKEFLKSGKDEIFDALRICANSDNYPILIHCTQGKDRTGMMCMLLLAIANTPEDTIVNDYGKTQQGLAPVLPMMIKEMAKSGLSEEFATASPKYMNEVLKFLNNEYGGVQSYLERIGFSASWQERIRQIICP